MEDDFALRYVRIYLGVNCRAELVTLAPLALGQLLNEVEHGMKNYQAEVCRYQPKPKADKMRLDNSSYHVKTEFYHFP